MKKILLAIMLSSCWPAFGQQPDKHRFSYGFDAGVDVQTISLAVVRDNPSGYYATGGRPGVGAVAGIWSQWSITPALHIRPGLNLAYTANQVNFWSGDGLAAQRTYAFAEAELPLHFLWTGPLRRLPFKNVIVFGGRVSWNVAAEPDEAPVRFLPERFGLDLGLGAGFTWGKWTFQPELIYSFGVNNIHNFTNSAYDWAVGRVFRDRLCFRIGFGRVRM